MIYRTIAAALAAAISTAAPDISASGSSLPEKGTLLYHSYSAYSALDSNVFLFDFNSGEVSELSGGGFYNAMNADFGSHPYDVTFMAIDAGHDEWDIYRWNLLTGEAENLTYASGFRNEDPKFSPDGMKIIFKRGRWDSDRNDFVYDLAEIDLETNDITMLTSDAYEESMPYYSADGRTVYYARSHDGSSDIYKLDLSTLESSKVYCEDGGYSYYPVTDGDDLYFVKWYSADNRNDCIVRLSGGNAELMPFCISEYNCSDPFVSGGNVFYSSTADGSYDLHYFNGSAAASLGMLNTDLNELGAAYFSYDEALETARSAADQILSASDAVINTDADDSGSTDCFDLIALRRKLV